MKKAGKGSNGKSTGQGVRQDRKSGTGMSGSPKKGGHGGKFTWSGDGYSYTELGRFDQADVDSKDPNFEDPEVIVAN